MFQLKPLLEQGSPSIEEIEENCSHFLSKNKKELLDGFFLVRGTDSGLQMAKREFRTRKKVFSPGLFYFYNKFRPSQTPKREELVPCFGNNLANVFSHKQKYAVFPIGSNYKMFFHPRIEDFNYNDLIENHDLGSAPFKKLHEEIDNAFQRAKIIKDTTIEEELPFSEPFLEDLEDTYHTRVHDFMKVEKINSVYDQILKVIQKYKQVFKENFPDVLNTLQEYQKYFEKYFSGLKSTQSLQNGIDKKEVGLYAPDGFYYLTYDLRRRLKLEDL